MDEYESDFNTSYRDYSGSTRPATMPNAGAALDDYFATIRGRKYQPPDWSGYALSRLTAPAFAPSSRPLARRPPASPQPFVPAGPPQRYQVNILGDAVSGAMESAPGQFFLGTPGGQRGGVVGVNPGFGPSFGFATTPVNFQNFATYAREAPLSVITSILGHKYQQADPYEDPAGPRNEDALLTNLGQADFEGVLDNVIDGLTATGDAIWAPFVGFTDWVRNWEALDRGKAIRDIVATGSTPGRWINRIASLFDQSKFDWNGIAAKAAERGVSQIDMMAELWDLDPAIVEAIAARPDMTDDEIHKLTDGQPFSYDVGANLIAELAVLGAPMLAGGWAARGIGAAAKASGLLRGQTLAELGLLGRPLAVAERTGSWALRAAQNPVIRTAGALTGFTPTGLKVGAGIRFGEWALKQVAELQGNDAAIAMIDNWLWEMPLSNNPGLMMIDAFAVHPLRGAKAAARGAREQAAKVFGRSDPIDMPPAFRRNLGTFEAMELDVVQERFLDRLGWDSKAVGALFGDGGPMTVKDLKNFIVNTALQVVRRRHADRARYLALGEGNIGRNEAFLREYGDEAARLVRDELAGRGTAIADEIKTQFWERHNLEDASELGMEGGIGPYDGSISLHRAAGWIRFSKQMQQIADEAVAGLRSDVNLDFVGEFRRHISDQYPKASDRISARDLNILQAYVPALVRDESGILRARKGVPVVTRRQLEKLLDRAEQAGAKAELKAARPRTSAVPALRPAEAESPKAIALAFKLRQDTVRALVSGIEPEGLGPIPADLVDVLRTLFSSTEDQLRRAPANGWRRALDWFNGQYQSALQRGEALDGLDEFAKALESRVPRGAAAADLEAIAEIRNAITHPYTEAELRGNATLRAIVDSRDEALTGFIDEMTRWLESPLRGLRVVQAGDVVVLEAGAAFRAVDVSIIDDLAGRAVGQRGLSPEMQAILADPAAHPLEKVEPIKAAMAAGMRVNAIQRARLAELGNLETTFAPLFEQAYGDGAPGVSRATVAKLTEEVAGYSDDLARLRDQAAALGGAVDRSPAQALAEDTRSFYERAAVLGVRRVGAGKVALPNWKALPIEPSAVRTVVNEAGKSNRLAAIDGKIATVERVRAELDAAHARASARAGQITALTDYDFAPEPVSTHPTLTAARDAAKELRDAGIPALVEKVGNRRWAVRRGNLRERPAEPTRTVAGEVIEEAPGPAPQPTAPTPAEAIRAEHTRWRGRIDELAARGVDTMEWPGRGGIARVIVSPDPRIPGQFRVTHLDADGTPTGHIEAKTLAEAIEIANGSADIFTEPVGAPRPPETAPGAPEAPRVVSEPTPAVREALEARAAAERAATEARSAVDRPVRGDEAAKNAEREARRKVSDEATKVLDEADRRLNDALRDVPLETQPRRRSDVDPRLRDEDAFGYTSQAIYESTTERILRMTPEQRPRFIIANRDGYATPLEVARWDGDVPIGLDGKPVSYGGQPATRFRAASLDDLRGNGVSRAPTDAIARELYLREQLYGVRPEARAALERFRATQTAPGDTAGLDEFIAAVRRAYEEAPEPAPSVPEPPPIVERIDADVARREAQQSAYLAEQDARQAAFRAHAETYPERRKVPVAPTVDPYAEIKVALRGLDPNDQVAYDALVERYGLEEVSAAENALERAGEAALEWAPIDNRITHKTKKAAQEAADRVKADARIADARVVKTPNGRWGVEVQRTPAAPLRAANATEIRAFSEDIVALKQAALDQRQALIDSLEPAARRDPPPEAIDLYARATVYDGILHGISTGRFSGEIVSRLVAMGPDDLEAIVARVMAESENGVTIGGTTDWFRENYDAVMGRATEPRAVVPAPAEVTFLDPADNKTPIRSIVVLVDAGDVLTSDQAGFPANLQPRARDIREASRQQIDAMAKELQPDKLFGVVEGAEGMPVVTPEGAVLAGNGRIMAIRAAPQGSYALYRVRLEAEAGRFGFDLESLRGMRRPVLVREIAGVDPVVQQRLAWQLNPTLPPADLAPSVASGLTRSAIAGLRIGDEQSLRDALLSVRNADAVRSLVDTLPVDWRQRYFEPGKGLNRDGLDLFEGAVLAKLLRADDRTLPAFAEARALVVNMVEDASDDMRRVTAALAESAGQLLKAQDAAETGLIGTEILQFSDDLVPALRQIQSLRQRDFTFAAIRRELDTVNAFEEFTLTPQQNTIAKILAHSDSTKEITTFLRGVAKAGEINPATGMELFAEARVEYSGLLNEAIRGWNELRRTAGKAEIDYAASTEPPYDVPLTLGTRDSVLGQTLPPVVESQPLSPEGVAGEVRARTAGEPVHAVVESVADVDPSASTMQFTEPLEATYARSLIDDAGGVMAELEELTSTFRAMDRRARIDFFSGLRADANAGTITGAGWRLLRELTGYVRRAKTGRLNMTYDGVRDIGADFIGRVQAEAQRVRGRTIGATPDGAAIVHRPRADRAPTPDELAVDVGPDVPARGEPGPAEALATTGRHVIVTNESAQTAGRIRDALDAPRVRDTARRVIEFNAPEARAQAERLEGLRQQATAQVEALRAERAQAELEAVPVREVESVFATPELADQWDRLMRAGLDPGAVAFGSVEPYGLASLMDAIESIDRGIYKDPLTGVGLEPLEAQALRTYLMQLAERSLQAGLDRRGLARAASAAERFRRPPDDWDVDELADRTKILLDDMAQLVDSNPDLPPLAGFMGSQYNPTPPPKRVKGKPAEPLPPRLFFRDYFADDIIPGLFDEISTGRIETLGRRIGNSRFARVVEHIMGPRPEREIRARAIDNFKREVRSYADETVATAEELRQIDKVSERAFNLWREELETHRVFGFPLYRRIHQMGPEVLNRGFERAIEEVYGAGKRPAWYDAMRTSGRDAAKLWRRADNRLRNYLAESDLRLSQALERYYGRATDIGTGAGAGVTTLYYALRFLGDLRWLALEAVEPLLLTIPRAGIKPVLEASVLRKVPGIRGVAERAREPLAFGVPTQIEAFRNYAHWAQLSDTAITPSVRHRYLLRALAAEQRKPFRQAMLDMVDADPMFRRMLDELGDTPDQFLRRLDRDWSLAEQGTRQLESRAQAEALFGPWRESKGGVVPDATVDDWVAARRYTSHPAIEAELAQVVGDPVATALYGRLRQINHELFHDLTAMFFGQENRSNLQRALNHPFIYWPVSYQIKATKWLLRFMGEEAFGVDTGAAGGFLLQTIAEEHKRRMLSDERYRTNLRENATLYFMASMLLPITPYDIGVSMSPWTRMLIDPEYQRAFGIFGVGPFYTYGSLLPRMIAEQSRPGGLLAGGAGERLQQLLPPTYSAQPRRRPTSTIDAENQLALPFDAQPVPDIRPEVPRLP